MNNRIKGYKVFNPDWTCRDFKYEVGKTYQHDGDIELCGSGFHFCVKAADCFNYYSFDSNNKVAEVEAIGVVETSGDKSVTNEIKIVRELDWSEVLQLVNLGNMNSGYRNSGDWNSGNKNSGDMNPGNKNSGDINPGNKNSGDMNSGNRNSGDWNSGNGNSGDWNSGNKNSGNKNSGIGNSGYMNSGNMNSGDWNSGNKNSGNNNSGNMNSGIGNSGNVNSGDWNSGNGNSGVFCTEEPKIKIFDIQTDMTLSEWRKTEAARILYYNFEQNIWVHSENMSDEEKEQHPEHITTGGYLKQYNFKEACENMWNNLTHREKEVIKNIPNFNKEKFKEITGITV